MASPETQFKLVFGFAAIGHFLFHVLVALYLTIVLVLEAEWQRSYEELIALWTFGALLLGWQHRWPAGLAITGAQRRSW